MKTKIYCPDIECDSCVKLIEKRLSKIEGIESHKITDEYAEIVHNDTIKEKDLTKLFHDAGFRAGTEPFERKTLKERLRHVKENKDSYKLEIKAFKDALWIFLILSALELIAYLGIFKNSPGFLSHYGIWFFYLNISVASIGTALYIFIHTKLKLHV